MREGASAVTPRRGVEEAGVTAMATYRHYPNREAQPRTVVDTAVGVLTEDWGQYPDDLAFAERVDRLTDDFHDFALGRPNLYAFLVDDRREDARRFPEDFRDSGSPAFTPARRGRAGSAGGRAAGRRPLETALALTTSVIGLAWLYHSGRASLPEDEFRLLCKRTTRRVLNGPVS